MDEPSFVSSFKNSRLRYSRYMTLNGKEISFLINSSNSLKLYINEDLTVTLRLDGLKIFYEFFFL